MYRPKKYVRLDPIPRTPKLSDVRNLLAEANRSRGCTIEQPWRSENKKMPFSLTVRIEVGGGEPIWTLYEGESNNSRVQWSTAFGDVDLLYDVLTLSLPSDGPNIFAPDESLPTYPQSSSTMATTPPSQDEATLRARDYFESSVFESAGGFDLFTGDQPDAFEKPKKKDKAKVQDVAPSVLPDKSASYYAVGPQTQGEAQVLQQSQMPQAQIPQPQITQAQYQQAQFQQAYYPQPQMQQANFQQAQYQQAFYPQPQYPPSQAAQYPQAPFGQFAQAPAYPPTYATSPDFFTTAGTVPLNGGATTEGAGYIVSPLSDLVKKRPNIMLGTFLLESGIVPKHTVDAALQVQTMVSQGTLSAIKAAEAVRRAHTRGGALEPEVSESIYKPNEAVVRVKPQLGQVLVMAGIISAAQLKMALHLQDEMRSGQLDMDSACARLQAVPAAAGSANVAAPSANPSADPAKVQAAMALLFQSGLIDKSQGLDLNGNPDPKRVDPLTLDAALVAQSRIDSGSMRIDKAIMTLHYCQRMRVPFDEAVSEMAN